LHADSAAPRATLLVFVGTGQSVEEVQATLVAWSAQLRVNVLAYDYRGAGRSDGKSSVAKTRDDAHAVIEAWKKRPDAGPARLVLLGVSLGAMTAAELVAEAPDTYAAVVLDSAATNVQEWAANLMPWYAAPFVTLKVTASLAEIDAEAAVRRVQTPLLIVVGDADDVTPTAFSRRLFAASRSPIKELHVFRGAGHAESNEQAGYVPVLDRFLARVGL
jgi:hypothetical protein